MNILNLSKHSQCLRKSDQVYFFPFQRNLTDYFSFVDPKNMISIFCRYVYDQAVLEIGLLQLYSCVM